MGNPAEENVLPPSYSYHTAFQHFVNRMTRAKQVQKGTKFVGTWERREPGTACGRRFLPWASGFTSRWRASHFARNLLEFFAL